MTVRLRVAAVERRDGQVVCTANRRLKLHPGVILSPGQTSKRARRLAPANDFVPRATATATLEPFSFFRSSPILFRLCLQAPSPLCVRRPQRSSPQVPRAKRQHRAMPVHRPHLHGHKATKQLPSYSCTCVFLYLRKLRVTFLSHDALVYLCI